MLVIGLTGSIGSGKSVVSELMQGLGAVLINADLVGHEAYLPNSEGLRAVVEAFGEEILQDSGEIDRRKLGGIVFSDPERLAELNRIMHPRIAAMIVDKLDDLRSGEVQVAVVEAAILLEAGWDSLVEEIWATDSPVDVVIQRLQARNGMSEEEVLKRLGSQMDRSERLALVDVVVDNSGDMAQLEKTINSLWDSRVKKRIAHA
ncbi:MAG: dephospho-CoA kinase [Dehalococcoidia bacterium]|nr:dephospho-CoA kinase [Dehalococcoidia bacterium]MDP7084153.1 dephospho-CoA kinase [Dehalococcoidia bacterium]MDP7199767.1 dephospho-CoA kinase [Dehalococcoidia bacterium]MDP7512041.1 dephospho-CoA kinase [Dehalococcoidia bacterium]HJN87152.1 dephospho-CoA kinase [Dehalococcoidia bacterium]